MKLTVYQLTKSLRLQPLKDRICKKEKMKMKIFSNRSQDFDEECLRFSIPFWSLNLLKCPQKCPKPLEIILWNF